MAIGEADQHDDEQDFEHIELLREVDEGEQDNQGDIDDQLEHPGGDFRGVDAAEVADDGEDIPKEIDPEQDRRDQDEVFLKKRNNALHNGFLLYEYKDGGRPARRRPLCLD